MARPMQLVECVAAALGIETSTVVTHDRNLLAAGLRTKGGHGGASARMTSRDAANLLIAAAGTARVQDSVKAVEAFGGLVIAGKPTRPPLSALGEGHTFGEALAACIQGFVDDSFISLQPTALFDFEIAPLTSLGVEMTRPKYGARIQFKYSDHTEPSYDYRPSSVGGEGVEHGDMETATKFSHVTLQQIGQLLRG